MIDYYEKSCHHFGALIRPIHQERTENATSFFHCQMIFTHFCATMTVMFNVP